MLSRKLKFLIFIFLALVFSHELNGQSVDIFRINAPDTILFERTRRTLIPAKFELEDLLKTSMTDTITVFIAENRFDFDTAVFGGVPDWGVGVAIASRNYISVMSPTKAQFKLPFEEVLRHELAHIALSNRVNGNPIPRFLNEGFAMMFAHQWSFGDDLTLARASLTGSFMSLIEIDMINMKNASHARIAYAQSFQAVKFIRETFGKETFIKILDGFKEGKPVDRVFRENLGTDFAGIDKLFAKYLSTHYHWFMIFTDPIFIWIGLAVVVIIGFLLIKRRRRDYYKKWEEEEKLESTDFDYEESSPWD